MSGPGERYPDNVGRFGDDGSRVVSPPPPKGWVMTEDGWRQVQRPPWSPNAEFPRAVPYHAPFFGSPLSGPAAAALAAANERDFPMDAKPEAIETRTHRVVANNPAPGPAARKAVGRLRFLRRLGVLVLIPVLAPVIMGLSILAVAYGLIIGTIAGRPGEYVGQTADVLGEAWEGLGAVVHRAWFR